MYSSLSLHMYIYICICICMYIYIYIYICMHIFTCRNPGAAGRPVPPPPRGRALRQLRQQGPVCLHVGRPRVVRQLPRWHGAHPLRHGAQRVRAAPGLKAQPAGLPARPSERGKWGRHQGGHCKFHAFRHRDLLGTPINLRLSSQKCQGVPFSPI